MLTVSVFRTIWLLMAGFWIGAEVLLFNRSKPVRTKIVMTETHSAKLFWFTFSAAIVAALLVKQEQLLPINLAYLPRQLIALALFGAGLQVRYLAVKELKSLFSPHITLYNNHDLIKSGIYRYLRHPSYGGVLLAFLGMGVAMGDYLAIVILLLPTGFIIHRRIILEEKLLTEHWGNAYQDYCRLTWKLVPWLY